MSAPRGTLIAYATNPGSTVSDGNGKNGLYTSSILENIMIPNITIFEMFQIVKYAVTQKSNNQQTPWESTSLTGKFFFNTDLSIDSDIPLWLNKLRRSDINVKFGFGEIKIGLNESEVIKILGSPDNSDSRVMTINNNILQYEMIYKYKNIGFIIYPHNKTKKVYAMRLFDSDFNSSGYIPSIKGITIGSTSEMLIAKFGHPLKTQKHYTCDFNKENLRAYTYFYDGIYFWICACNNLIYLIGID